MTKWVKTEFPGVRYRKHETRKHGVRFDQYFTIRVKVKGKDHEEAIGWASEGATSAKAYDRLKEIKDNIKNAEGPQSLREKRHAEEKRRQDEKSAAKQLEKENKTFSQFFTETYTPIAETSKKTKSFTHEQTHCKLWIDPIIGDKPIKEITAFDAERIKKGLLKAGRSPRTIQYVMATVRQVWNMARRDGLVSNDSPTKGVKVPKFDNRRQRFLNHGEATGLLNLLKGKDEQTYRMALLSLQTGMRASEIFNLKWGCIDTERGLITILDAKSGKGRPAFMTEQIKEMFNAMTKGKTDALIFPNSKGGVFTEIPHPFRESVATLGLNDGTSDRRQRVCFHSLRHTFASWHAEAQTDLYVIKELMGHGSITLTERYSHLTQGALQAATGSLERAMEEARKKAAGENVVNMAP